MKAIGFDDFGGPDVLNVVTKPTPEPGRDEVRIRVHAAGVNPTDLTFRSGGRAAQLVDVPPPWVPGMDLVGTIEALGAMTDHGLTVGDLVIAYVMPFGPHGGAYAEQVVVPAAAVVPAPLGVTLPQAATVLLNAVTARLALDALALTAGQSVVITGAAGGVGGFAVELARADGLTVVAQARPGDSDLVSGFGADFVVESGPLFGAAVTDALGGPAAGVVDGADLRVDALPALIDGGRLASLKGWTGPAERDIAVHVISSYGSARDTMLLDRIARQAERGLLTPRVADVLPAARAAEAHRRLEAGGVRGRLVLDFASPLE
jgi:NADPH:quinone reductase-like Zn-dependent oxidoreductase